METLCEGSSFVPGQLAQRPFPAATVDGVLTLTRLHIEDCDGGDAGGGHGPHDGGCDH
ncbi:MAG: hypothetical protein WAL31_00460 [Gaiellaceae bacterium]